MIVARCCNHASADYNRYILFGAGEFLTMLDYMFLPLKRYVQFEGRARRMEYWSFALFCMAVYAVLLIPALVMGFSPMAMDAAEMAGSNPFAGVSVMAWLLIGLAVLFGLAVLLPSIAVTVRRLHDRDMSGWWYLGLTLAGMIPFVGWIASIGLIVLMFLPGTPGPNRFGDDPKDPAMSDVFA